MLVIGLVLLIAGAVVAALLERTIGLVVAAVGLIFVLIALLDTASVHDALVLLR